MPQGAGLDEEHVKITVLKRWHYRFDRNTLVAQVSIETLSYFMGRSVARISIDLADKVKAGEYLELLDAVIYAVKQQPKMGTMIAEKLTDMVEIMARPRLVRYLLRDMVKRTIEHMDPVELKSPRHTRGARKQGQPRKIFH